MRGKGGMRGRGGMRGKPCTHIVADNILRACDHDGSEEGRMAKTISVAELTHGGVSRAIRDAQNEPVLVSKENRPAAWIFSARKLADVAAARGEEAAATYQRALELMAVELYRDETLTLGQGAKLAGLHLNDFIDLCGRLRVPILWEPMGGLEGEVQRLEALLPQQQSSG